jgi:two-component system, OmpR family, osmolarity sensor histidine kinase EnvZ
MKFTLFRPVWRRLSSVIKRRLPKSLGWRAVLIIVLPIGVMQLAVTWMFFQMHWETVTARLSEGLVGDIAWAVSAYKKDPTPLNLARINTEAGTHMQLSIALQKDADLPAKKSTYGALDASLKRALRQQIDDAFWFDTVRYPGVVDIRIKVRDGTLRIIAPKDRAFATTGHIFIFWVALATFVLTTVAIAFIRNQVRAIERLSKAAEAFGRGEDDPTFKPYGASEVRAAARAFIDMRDRIGRHIEQRTTLLASVSHDLRTPLTRLKLELAMADPKTPPGDALTYMRQDVSEMAYMIDEYLAFARGEAAESTDQVSINTLMAQIAEAMARTGHKLDIVPLPDDLTLPLRDMAVRRAISNLVMNGFHHATRVVMTAETLSQPATGTDHLWLHIDDNGPGIAPDKRDDAFKAFNRLDESRNQNVKGVGLGLAIARDIIRGHGGELSLADSPLGGLRASVQLPVT